MTEPSAAGSARVSAGLVLSAALPAAALAALTGPTLDAAGAPGADPSALLCAVAVLLGWGVVARLALVAAVVVGCRAPGAVGAAAARCLDRLTPAVMRSVVRLAMGASVAAAPLAGSAVAQAAPPDPVVVAAAAGLPTLDRLITAPVALVPGSAGPPAATSVLVRPGDSLWTIAAGHLPPGHTVADVARSWPRWYAANRAAIGDDPSRIRPGQLLRVPLP